MNRQLYTRIGISLAGICAFSLAACFAVKPPPPPVVTGSALALPAVGSTLPVYVYLVAGQNLGISVKREMISGVTFDGKEFHAESAEDAATGAGGSDKLLAALSDETEIAHVAKLSGAILGMSTLQGLEAGCQGGAGGGGFGVLVCAAGGALGMAVGLVGAVGAATYLGVSRQARQIGMLDDVALPNDIPGNPRQGYIFLPAEKYEMLRISVVDPRTNLPQSIEVRVVQGSQPPPGQRPRPRPTSEL